MLYREVGRMAAQMIAATQSAVSTSPGSVGNAAGAAAQAAIEAAASAGGGAVAGFDFTGGGGGGGAVLPTGGNGIRSARGGITINNTINNEMDIDKMTNLMARRLNARFA